MNGRAYVAWDEELTFFAALNVERTATSKLNVAEMLRKRVLTSFFPL
jgi:hypothetical protein